MVSRRCIYFPRQGKVCVCTRLYPSKMPLVRLYWICCCWYYEDAVLFYLIMVIFYVLTGILYSGGCLILDPFNNFLLANTFFIHHLFKVILYSGLLLRQRLNSNIQAFSWSFKPCMLLCVGLIEKQNLLSSFYVCSFKIEL